MTDHQQLLVDDLEVQLIRSRRRKTLSLEIGQHGLRARAPWSMREATIIKFVQSKRRWIQRHLANRPPALQPVRLNDGAELMIMGEAFTLRVANGRQAVRVSAAREIIVPVAESHLPLAQRVANKLQRWYRELALEMLSARVEVFQSHLHAVSGKSYTHSGVRVREYKQRWGSCDHRQRLSFNWRLIMAPAATLDYVVVHELCHLQVFNHSRRFWRLVETALPNWREDQHWLQQHGQQLYRW